MTSIVKRGIISNLFVQPVIQEREAKRVAVMDTKEIFSRIRSEVDFLSYPQAVEIIQDLAYLTIPFDKTEKEFNMLMSRLKMLLQAQNGMVKMHGVVDACLRLGIESLNGTIKTKVEEGNYSRAPEDLCTLLYFFSYQYKIQHSQRDLQLFSQVLKELKHMQFQNLKIENLHYLLSALKFATEPQVIHNLQKQLNGETIDYQDFLPQVMLQTFKELNRCMMQDIVLILQSFGKLWDKNLFNQAQLRQVYQECEAYMLDYLGKYKKDITGTDFAILVEQLGFASLNKVYTFDHLLIERLQHIFINDSSELYNFSYSDLLRILSGFHNLNHYFNKSKVIGILTQLVLDTESYSGDRELLEIVKYYLREGMLSGEKNQELAVKLRVYFQERFNYMERDTVMEYLEVFKDLGMLYEDKEVMIMLREQFQKSFHGYELNELLKIYKLISHNYYRDTETLQILEDAVKIRVSDPAQRSNVTVQSIKDLIEGQKLHLTFNKRLDSSLRALIKNNPQLLAQDKLLLIQYLCYCSDFNQPIDPQQLSDWLSIHSSDLTQEDKAHLYCYLGDALPADYRPASTYHPTSLDSQEKLSFRSLSTLDPVLVQQRFSELFEDSNITELVEQLLKHYDKPYKTRQLLANNTVKAAFLVDDKIAIDIWEDQMAYYIDKKTGTKHMRAKARAANEILNKEGKEYRVISLVEMDFAQNEDKFLRDVLGFEQ